MSGRERIWAAMAGVVLLMLIGVVVAGARSQGVLARSSTFRPEADDGLQRSVRLIDVHSIDDLAMAMQRAYGRPVQIHRDQVEFIQARRLEFAVPEVDVASAFRLVNSQSCEVGRVVDWRTFPTHVEIGERMYFEKLSVERREYDLTAAIRAWRAAATEDSPSPCPEDIVRKAKDLIERVRSEYWEDNGGDAASLTISGATLLVDAPRDMHPEIARMLGAFERAARQAAFSNPKPLPRTGSGGMSPMCFGPSSAWSGGVGP